MTINELEQGIRNLIATQPMVTTGPSGDVVNGVLSLIDAFRNFNFKLQTYPSPDALKFNLTGEIQKLEANFTNMVINVLQERGINIMLYVPRNQTAFGPMVNQYGVVGASPDPSMMMGQMMYNSGVLPQNQNMMAQPTMAPMGAYNHMQPQMQGVAMQYPPRQQRAHAPVFPGYESPKQAVRLEPQTSAGPQGVRSAPQSKVSAAPKTNPINEVVKTAKAPVEEAPAAKEPSAAEMLMGAFDGDVGAGKGKAAGRDYLMELLKK